MQKGISENITSRRCDKIANANSRREANGTATTAITRIVITHSQNATWEESFRENTSVIYAETRQSFYRLRR